LGQEHDADVVVVVVDTPQQGGHLPPDGIASQYHLPEAHGKCSTFAAAVVVAGAWGASGIVGDRHLH